MQFNQMAKDLLKQVFADEPEVKSFEKICQK